MATNARPRSTCSDRVVAAPSLRAVAVPPEALQKVAALSGVGADAKLSDVEDHLDDVTRDFSNAELLP